MATKKGKKGTKPKSPAQKQRNLLKKYNTQLNRINKLIEKEKQLQGVVDEKLIPKMPKNITEASINRLKKITATTVIEHTKYYNAGKLVKGVKGRASVIREKNTVNKALTDLKNIVSEADDILDNMEVKNKKATKNKSLPSAEEMSNEQLEKYHNEYERRREKEAREKIKEQLRKEWEESGDDYYKDSSGQIDEDLLDLAVDKEIEIQKQKTKDWTDAVDESEKEKNNKPKKKPSDDWKDKHDYSDEPANQTDEVLKQLEDMIDSWQPHPGWSKELIKDKTREKNTLKKILEGAIERDGRKEVANRAEQNAPELIALASEILYESGGTKFDYFNKRDKVQWDLNRVAEIINGGPLDMDESADLTDIGDDDWDDMMDEDEA